MAYRNLQEFITRLEKEDELIIINGFVDPVLEMAEIADRLIKNGGKAVLFNQNGTDFPVLMNAYGSYRRMCIALNVENLEEAGERLENLFKELSSPRINLIDKLKLLPSMKNIASWMPKSVKHKGECQAVILNNPDLGKLPVIMCWPHDGGPFITLPVVHTKDPETGMRNVGMYRMQVFGPDRTGMHWHLHKNSARHYNEYKRLKKRMPVVVTLGGDPVYTYSATAPLPDNVDEYMLAGFLRKQRVELVKCLTCDLEVPSDVDFVIEGYVDPEEDKITEGPFGDHTGYYSLEDYYPVFHVTMITHRQNAIFPATIVGIPPMEDYYIGMATERIFLRPLRITMLPEILDMHMPAEGVFHNLVLVKIKKSYPGQAVKVMNSLWGAGQMMFNKVMLVLDQDVDLTDYRSVLKVVLQEIEPARDIIISRGPVDVLDHSSSVFALGGKIGIDATTKTDEYGIVKESFTGNQVSDSVQDSGIKILPVHKSEKGQVRKMAEWMMAEGELNAVKVLVFVEPMVDPEDMMSVVWRVANNIDPQRDCFVLENKSGPACSVLVIDGTRKYATIDGFNRPWPNILVMDDITIKNVDTKWEALGLGEFIESPSLRFRNQLYPGGARASD